MGTVSWNQSSLGQRMRRVSIYLQRLTWKDTSVLSYLRACNSRISLRAPHPHLTPNPPLINPSCNRKPRPTFPQKRKRVGKVEQVYSWGYNSERDVVYHLKQLSTLNPRTPHDSFNIDVIHYLSTTALYLWMWSWKEIWSSQGFEGLILLRKAHPPSRCRPS